MVLSPCLFDQCFEHFWPCNCGNMKQDDFPSLEGWRTIVRSECPGLCKSWSSKRLSIQHLAWPSTRKNIDVWAYLSKCKPSKTSCIWSYLFHLPFPPSLAPVHDPPFLSLWWWWFGSAAMKHGLAVWIQLADVYEPLLWFYWVDDLLLMI